MYRTCIDNYWYYNLSKVIVEKFVYCLELLNFKTQIQVPFHVTIICIVQMTNKFKRTMGTVVRTLKITRYPPNSSFHLGFWLWGWRCYNTLNQMVIKSRYNQKSIIKVSFPNKCIKTYFCYSMLLISPCQRLMQ